MYWDWGKGSREKFPIIGEEGVGKKGGRGEGEWCK